MIPVLKVKASSGIADPDVVVVPALGEDPNFVAAPTRLDLFRGQITILFTGCELVAFTSGESIETLPLDPLLYFIVYRSRVNYNGYCVPRAEFPHGFEAAKEVVFSLGRLVAVERDEEIGGVRCQRTYHEIRPWQARISLEEFEQYLRALQAELHMAITYFLIGCENVRYFLVEFYKCLEVIRKAFGGKSEMLGQLQPYGLVRNDYEKLMRYCNDDRNPINVGRHAPEPGSRMRFVDFRNLLTEPFSREVWSESVRISRQAIDAYCGHVSRQGGAPE